MGILKCSITQSETERIKRGRVAQNIFPIAGRFMVVIAGQLTDGARNRDGKFAGGIHFPKNHIRSCAAGFLPEIPAFDDCRSFFAYFIDRQRPSVDEQHHGRFAELKDCFRKFILTTRQIQIIPVSQMFLAPCFTTD